MSPDFAQDIPRPPGARAQLQTREPTIAGAEAPGFRTPALKVAIHLEDHSPIIRGEQP